MSMAPNSWTEFRFYQHLGIASTMLLFAFAPRDKKLCSWVMSCITRCRYTFRISALSTVNFQKPVGTHGIGSFLMLRRIKHFASLLISQKLPPAMSAGEKMGFNGNSFNPRFRNSKTRSKLRQNVFNHRMHTAITTEDFFVPSDTAGIDLHLRRKRLAHVENFPSERTLLLMHGATFSSGSLFDAPVGGASFMDELAAAGFDVYAVDVRGYGASTRPPETAGAVDPSHQPVRIETAIRDLGTAVNSILESRKLDQLNLVAMSWGGSIAGGYTAKNPDKIKRLALIAPLWLRETPGR